MILRATYRTDADHDQIRRLDIEKQEYDEAFEHARAETREGEHLIHVQTLNEA